MRLMMGGLIGYYGRAVPLSMQWCQQVVAVQEYVARRRGFGTGRPHRSLFDAEHGLGWPHPYEFVAATLVDQVDSIVSGSENMPARTAFFFVLMQVAYRLGCTGIDPLEWLPLHLEQQLTLRTA